MKRPVTVLLVLGAMALCASAGDAATNVLVACQASEFRSGVAQRLGERLQQEGCTVKRIDVSGLAAESATNYRAVVICDAVRMWSMNRHVHRFLARTDDKARARVIVLNTAGNDTWRSKEPGIQAITTASVVTKVDGTVAQLLDRVHAAFGAAGAAPEKAL